MRRWYAGKLGQRLLASERAQLNAVLPDLFGYHLLQIGLSFKDDLLGSSRISHRVVMDPDVRRPGHDVGGNVPNVHLWGKPESLPLQSDALDVVVLPHTLEYEAHPHEVLREIDRVLVAEGHVVILGFNPWSLWGIWRLLRFRRRRPPWSGNFRSILRLKDWLALLGFDPVYTRSYFFRPPLKHHGIMSRLAFLECIGRRWWPFLGGAYILVARKRVVSLTLVKPRWRPRRRLMEVDPA